MTTYAIETRKYDIDLPRVLGRRLEQCGLVCGIMCDACQGACAVTVTVQDGDAVTRLAEALSLLLCRDLRYFELARYADQLPGGLTEKQAVLTAALDRSAAPEELAHAKKDLAEYLAGASLINLEGYLFFRLQRLLIYWRTLIARTAEEIAVQREYGDLMHTLNAYVRAQKPHAGELSICLNPDGSCTLTDDSDARIEYVDCSEDGVLSLLIGMAPAFLTVYDLTGGTAQKLTNALRRVFSGRVRIYR